MLKKIVKKLSKSCQKVGNKLANSWKKRLQQNSAESWQKVGTKFATS